MILYFPLTKISTIDAISDHLQSMLYPLKAPNNYLYLPATQLSILTLILDTHILEKENHQVIHAKCIKTIQYPYSRIFQLIFLLNLDYLAIVSVQDLTGKLVK